MANPFIPREQVHAWSDAIGDEPGEHQAAMQRLLKDQRRLTRFLQENGEELEGATGGVGIYLLGCICRMFELAGGRLRKATWAQVREAEAAVQSKVVDVLPIDDGLPERLRGLDRAQPHILDEALMALFEREPEEEEENLSPEECAKVYFLLWVCTEVLDGNWSPKRDFAGLDSYEYVHIEPTKKEKAEATA